MDNEIQKQRYYIYENIDNLKDHNQIINLIKLKDCKFTENCNGIFLNISALDKDIINIIYKILTNTVEYKEEGNIIADNPIKTEESIHPYTYTQPLPGLESFPPLDDLLMENYSIIEKEIITYSKQYNL
jgi:hypothetical protein|tara:strand:+ start:1046 stop:1432 length:387 start_codon:yes stop_codon:yes gene_type:complete